MSRIGQDYIRDHSSRRTPPVRWLVLACVLPLMVGAFAMTMQPAFDTVTEDAASTTGSPDTATKILQIAPLAVPARQQPPNTNNDTRITVAHSAKQAEEHTNTEPKWLKVQIHSGDTLSAVFNEHDLSFSDALALAHLKQYGHFFTTDLRAGDIFRIRANDNGHVIALNHSLDAVRTLKVRTTGDGYTAHVEKADTNRRKAYAVGTIDESFYVDAKEAGLTDRLIMRMVHIFEWQVDFARAIRQGDQFIVVYEQIYSNGQLIRSGNILAAEFINQGERVRALRYTDNNGDPHYYAPDGTALRKAFRRIPLDDDYYISSSFSTARDHPILNKIREHEGTDFAAPMGTSIHATGDGVITFRGVMSGYGNMVIIDHGDNYTTRYGHMTRFASGQHEGSHVERGEVIGYVGMTGLATGPHVHYEFRVNGVPRDPMDIELPGAPPVPQTQMAEFRQQTHALLAQIKSLERLKLASVGSPE